MTGPMANMECRFLGIPGCRRMEPGAASSVRMLGTGGWARRAIGYFRGHWGYC